MHASSREERGDASRCYRNGVPFHLMFAGGLSSSSCCSPERASETCNDLTDTLDETMLYFPPAPPHPQPSGLAVFSPNYSVSNGCPRRYLAWSGLALCVCLSRSAGPLLDRVEPPSLAVDPVIGIGR